MYKNRKLKKVGATQKSVPRAPVVKYGNLGRGERITFRRLRWNFSILKSAKEYAKRASSVTPSNHGFPYYLLPDTSLTPPSYIHHPGDVLDSSVG
jgi:hypothetical protein